MKSLGSTATLRLHAALADQARLGEMYEQSVGTESEQSRYAQLRAASTRVARYERVIDVFERPGVREPSAG